VGRLKAGSSTNARRLTGMQTTSTREETMTLEAAPAMTPNERSTLLPSMATSLIYLSQDIGPLHLAVHLLGAIAPRDGALQNDRFAVAGESRRTIRIAMAMQRSNLVSTCLDRVSRR
jgi:hypothetical protein